MFLFLLHAHSVLLYVYVYVCVCVCICVCIPLFCFSCGRVATGQAPCRLCDSPDRFACALHVCAQRPVWGAAICRERREGRGGWGGEGKVKGIKSALIGTMHVMNTLSLTRTYQTCVCVYVCICQGMCWPVSVSAYVFVCLGLS